MVLIIGLIKLRSRRKSLDYKIYRHLAILRSTKNIVTFYNTTKKEPAGSDFSEPDLIAINNFGLNRIFFFVEG